MTVRRTHLLVASFLSLLLFLDPTAGSSATKKRPAVRKKARRARAVVRAADLPTAVGNTFAERINSLVNGSVARGCDSSIKIVEVESGTIVAERNAHMPLAPASNMKLFTTAAALDMLRPSFQVTTRVMMRGTLDPTGTLTGDVKVTGHGDPTVGGRFHDGHATEVLDEWATDLKKAGVKTVRGDLIFEYGYMDIEYIHPTWPTDQLVNWYEAPISAFSLQEGCVQVRVLPGKPGQRAIVTLEPPTSFLNVENSCITGHGFPFITRRIGTNNVIVRGGVPTHTGATEVFVTVENPVNYFATVTNETFARNGIKVLGKIVLTPKDARSDWRFVTQHATPLNVIVYVINKKSQNHYAEQLVKIIGAERAHEGSWAAGTKTVTEWLTGKLEVPPGEFHQADGSGMSRFNRASSDAFIHLLRYMWKSPYREDFVSSMPYSGDPDSKFGKRLKHPPYARQVYAKTGYIVGVVGLSGYVHSQSGKIYAFSFLFNRYHVGVYAVYHLQDEMLKELITHG